MVADLLTDPAFEPWRSDAVQRGYRSSIALPLVVGDRVLGVLNIYARERDAFFEEEIRLLEQLAGNLAYGIVSLQVQAERTHIENDLREREGLLSAIVNSQIDLICRYTPDTILTFVNDAYCLYLGRSRQELVGRSFLTLVPEEQHAGIWARIEEAIRTHVPAVREYYTFSPGGEVRWVQWVDQAVQDNHGQLLIQAVGRDVTAQKQAEEALLDMNSQLEQRVKERTADLQAANERLQALSRVKDEFVSNVSHELRTPITSLKLRQHLVRKSPENLNQHLEVMERETNRLHHTIEDLLQLSRLDQRQTELTLSPVDINALVKQYISDRSTVAEANSLKVTLTENGALPVVAADVGLLEQCLGILMSNAINYTPPGGSITIEAVTQTIEGCRWAGFMVADNGPGILPEDQPHLFERFYRGTAAHKSGSRGTGLGLAIAREIVVRHGGRIEVESTGVPGEGARFTVWLPEQA